MNEEESSRLRQRIGQLEQSREPNLRALLEVREGMRKGSLVTLNRKCGKPTCHCAYERGGHPTKYFSIKESGKTRLIYVSAVEEVAVALSSNRYRRFREKRARLAKLSQEQLSLIDELAISLLERARGSQTQKRRRSDASKERSRKKR